MLKITKTSELTEVALYMVEYLLKNWHQIYEELIRWNGIIDTRWNCIGDIDNLLGSRQV